MRVQAFKIWYSDHTESGKSYKDWVALPNDDVQGVVLYFNEAWHPHTGQVYRHLANGNDYYALNERLEITHGDNPEAVHGHVKLGKWTTDENIDRITAEMVADEGYGFVVEPQGRADKAGQ